MGFSFLDKFNIYGPRRALRIAIWELRGLLGWGIITGSYSQGSEDIVVDKLLGNKKSGFYVDVGAFDPDKYSNTKRFYLRGWRGINIEPDPEKYAKFTRSRKMDVNLNIGIGLKKGMRDFYRFSPSPLSTFSKQVASDYQRSGNKLLGIKKIKVLSLADVLKSQRVVGNIDLMSVDVEGYDLQVLKSNDWSRYRPKVIILETGGLSELVSGKKNTPEHERFIISKSYKKVYDNGLNSIFVSAK